jgi:nitroimidazol reductase NimA-like FMN-containing flavoprotein (pyridoxamine 5'-phosphate oxidase superfamily)
VRVIHDRPRSVDVDEFLSRPLFAHLATTSEDGPRESPVWFLWEEGALWILGSRRTDSFPARLEREPRCAIGIVDFDLTTGLVQHVGFRGRATVEKLDRGREKRLLARYLGSDETQWDSRFRESLGDAGTVFVRFEPETAVARDVSYLASEGRAAARSKRPGAGT